jgi:hypothetical protein
MSTATAPLTATIRETLMREVSVLPADYCPKVLRFIETLKKDEEDVENWNDADWEEWLRSNPPIPIEDDPFFTPEHIERIQQRSKDMDEGRTKVITFTPEQLKEFWEEIKHSPEEAIAKARSRAHYRTPKQS